MKLPVLLCLLLPSTCVFAQKELMLTGVITMNTGEIFPYKLLLKEQEGKINGYSVTYAEPNETRTAVKGTLDRQARTLTFRETEIISSHNVYTKAYMCLANAKLQQTFFNGADALTGPATSAEADRTACTPGTITFTNSKEIHSLFSYHDQFDTVISMKNRPKETPTSGVSPTAPAPEKEQPPMTDKITAGTEKMIEWYSDTLVLDVWDGGTLDGDRVSISLNGKQYLNSQMLMKEKRQLRMPLHAGVNTLAIVAENEGGDPPNTASLMLTDGDKQYSVLAYNTKGSYAIIKVKKLH